MCSRRRRRYSRSLVLWTTLLKVIAVADATEIEQASQHWPVALRRRFVSALYERERDNVGPTTPARVSHSVFDLNATSSLQSSI